MADSVGCHASVGEYDDRGFVSHEENEGIMKKLVIIGANEFQNPLILKAKEMGYETHVFAWREGAVGAENADYFYPISIIEVDEILKECRRIKPDGVATIGSDLANVTVTRLADALGLPGNSLSCINKSTNKAAMRQAFLDAGIPTPFFQSVASMEELDTEKIQYPVIVKPTDRSGSRAITKVEGEAQLREAIDHATKESFEKRAIVESYLDGQEYSMESISYQGEHTCLAITKKYTTGAPHYIETGHMQPAPLSGELNEKAIRVIHHALDALDIKNGASHAEFRIDDQGQIHIIEIGSRMGGDCIGSHLVPLSTGNDFVKMVIQTAVGEKPSLQKNKKQMCSGIQFVLCEKDMEKLAWIKKEHGQYLVEEWVTEEVGSHQVVDSGSRFGYYILQTETIEQMEMIIGE